VDTSAPGHARSRTGRNNIDGYGTIESGRHREHVLVQAGTGPADKEFMI
jgi:hypothetical protein